MGSRLNQSLESQLSKREYMKRYLCPLLLTITQIVAGFANAEETAQVPATTKPEMTLQTIVSSDGAISAPRLKEGWDCKDKTEPPDESSQLKLSTVACMRTNVREFLLVFAGDHILKDSSKATLEIQTKEILHYSRENKGNVQKTRKITHQGVEGMEVQVANLMKKPLGKKEVASFTYRVFVKDGHVLLLGVLGSSKLVKKHQASIQQFFTEVQFRKLDPQSNEETKPQAASAPSPDQTKDPQSVEQTPSPQRGE